MEDFEKFWKAYPRKVAKGEARKAWMLLDLLFAFENDTL